MKSSFLLSLKEKREVNELAGIVQGYTDDVDLLRLIDEIELKYEKGEITKEEYDKMREDFGK